jgi:quercetin dioxygenase-like cupin family protein
MHATATVDAVLVTAGRIVLEAEDGTAVELVAGDTVLQLATTHRWRNDSGEAPMLVVFVVGAPS